MFIPDAFIAHKREREKYIYINKLCSIPQSVSIVSAGIRRHLTTHDKHWEKNITLPQRCRLVRCHRRIYLQHVIRTQLSYICTASLHSIKDKWSRSSFIQGEITPYLLHVPRVWVYRMYLQIGDKLMPSHTISSLGPRLWNEKRNCLGFTSTKMASELQNEIPRFSPVMWIRNSSAPYDVSVRFLQTRRVRCVRRVRPELQCMRTVLP